MRALRSTLLIVPAVLAFAADDPWAKVRELRSGTEVRIFRRAAKQPTLAKFDEVTTDNLVVVIKNEQTAIPKDDIDRLDARPSTGSRVKPESKVTSKSPGDPDATRSGPPSAYPGSSTSSSTSLNIGGKPDFETIYRRSPAPPKK
jgi:hypothetical protein